MATKYKSKFTGEQIDNSVETVVSNTATDGQVLTANGTGGSTWQDAKGTEVVANPSLAGTESDLTGLEVAGTKYKVPTEVVANPSLAGTESDLTGLEVAGTKYKVPTGGGTEVVANPVLAGTESDLTGLEVAGTKYKVPSGGSGGGTQLYLHNIILNSTDNFHIVSPDGAELTGVGVTENPLGIYYIVGKKTFSCFFEFLYDRMDTELNFYYYENGNIKTKTYPLTTSITDTVTPL